MAKSPRTRAMLKVMGFRRAFITGMWRRKVECKFCATSGNDYIMRCFVCESSGYMTEWKSVRNVKRRLRERKSV